MKNKRKLIISYIQNKILFDDIIGTLNIIEFKNYIIVNYTDCRTGSKYKYQISNNELIKYSRIIKL